MNNFNNFLSHLNSFGKPNLSDVPTSTPTKKPYMGGNYKKDQKLKLSKNKNEYYGSYEPASIAAPVVSGYNYPETMVGSFDPQPSEPAPPNNTTPTDSRPRDSMGHLLEASNITTFADHMKFLSNNSGKLNEEDTSYDDAEANRIRGANERLTTGVPQDLETVKNLDKAWDYRKSWLAKGRIKDAWNKMTPTQQQQARNYAKSKGRDFSEMDSALNETSNHNIFLNYLNSFFK